MNLSHTEENYLKAIYKIASKTNKAVSTNAISKEIKTTAASVTDMLKRLADKKLIIYKRYKGVSLTDPGKKIATLLIRKHRLWEYFLVKKLNFSWEEVHDVAEELEHINSLKLINELDRFLDFPKYDPHGDPIPNEKGEFSERKQTPLFEMTIGESGILVGVNEHSTEFLKYLNQIKLNLGSHILLKSRIEYDDSCEIQINNNNEGISLSAKVCKNLFIQINHQEEDV